MAKAHASFVCQQCGYKSPTMLGKCPECGNWNSFVETLERKANAPSWSGGKQRDRVAGTAKVSPLSEVSTTRVARIDTGIQELNQVLGGGLVPGSLVLLGGDPGIGKSTLTLQFLSHVGGLYVSGEESPQQVRLRADRLGLRVDTISILAETNVEAIVDAAASLAKLPSSLLVVDSIQTIWSEELSGMAGAVGQVRESTLKLLQFAKQHHVPVVLIGHVTKEGTIAGPKVLEHIVDTVLYLEGDRYQSLRLLRVQKNRFGPVDEVGVFSMEEKGMRAVTNPSEMFIGKTEGMAGAVAVATLEGTRPFLVEVQALTVATQIPVPRRIATGVNPNRLQMLVAILQKHLRLNIGTFDVFVNAASGVRIAEPAADLGVCLAIISSFKNKPLPPKTVAIGEVGLLGEIRPVIGQDRRIKEAKRLGYEHIISSKEFSHISRMVERIFV